MRIVLAIDPGNTASAYCLVDADSLAPVEFGKVENHILANMIQSELNYNEFVIERVASYGMPVGKEVFQTCEWIGRFVQIASLFHRPISYIYRKEEKVHICRDSRAKDANIRRALIDRFAKHDLTNGKGTKKDPDFFYGFRADCWVAYAVALTYIEAGASEREEYST